jgi:hypothetical protein
MTAADLAAVCERHRISVVHLCGGFYAAQGELTGEWTAGTPADAVAALLKARYRVGTVVKDEGQSDLEAVVILADRLAGVQG